ncbi:thioredoxin reductase (NADPH) [Paraburkholderia sp. BL6665CI2N2]|uniref:FAD-dependent oxidoreductase n=1 Tax=Paraburkholderia sp. BL6665CI2N2 TaxID=1938806 RepID=UPI001064B7EF|nr:FAD-dependent oxidoreductase [Paraburkholderia sp. BL6665CI2N2]TDY20926.1 thioredoxin reductase (NADPH) [Paraburkholderia sp. BL6665CI2N2]
MDNESVTSGSALVREAVDEAQRAREGELAEDPTVRDHPRFQQMFPVLTQAEVDRLRRFASRCRYAAGELLYRAGTISPGVFVLLSGKVRIVGRDGLGRERVVRTQTGYGEFTSDVAQLSRKPALLDAHVVEDVEALLLRPDGLTAMMMSEADLGEKIMRALILRRALIIERGQGVVLVGPPGNARLVALQDFLHRNGCPQTTIDAQSDAEAVALLDRLTTQPDDFPLVLCPNGTMLRNPDEGQLASCLGLVPEFDSTHVYDVAIIGAGPAGLATAVYAASEGLSVAAFDGRAPGGQAGTSSRIENYLGFPTGITGHALASRAFAQAQKFGAHLGIPCEVKMLYCDRHPFIVELADARRISARTVVIASGAEYRRLGVEGLARLESHGVYSWASPIEARLCRKESVLLVGGGNSAGQAVVFLASHAEHVHLFIRGSSLEKSMSHYLIERVTGLENVTVHTRTELTALEGDARLERVHFRGAGGIEGTMTAHHLFVFVGAEPNSTWLKTCGVSLDSKGFVLTGTDLPEAGLAASPLRTSIEGVFAIGDVRSGSIKRVAAAVGEGAAVVHQIHSYLAASGS